MQIKEVSKKSYIDFSFEPVSQFQVGGYVKYEIDENQQCVRLLPANEATGDKKISKGSSGRARIDIKTGKVLNAFPGFNKVKVTIEDNVITLIGIQGTDSITEKIKKQVRKIVSMESIDTSHLDLANPKEQKQVKKNGRIAFSFDGTEKLKVGSHYRYGIDRKNRRLVILPSDEKSLKVSRRKAKDGFKPLIDLKSQDALKFFKNAECLQVSVYEDTIIIETFETEKNSNTSFVQRAANKVKQALTTGKLIQFNEAAKLRKTSTILLSKKGLKEAVGQQLSLDDLFFSSSVSEEVSSSTAPQYPPLSRVYNNYKSVVELFAGVGGFRLGLEPAGFEVVFGNQWEPGTKRQYAFDCYAERFKTGIHSNMDIQTVDIDSIPNATMLAAGFPCQDYSVASTLNNSKGIEGKKGILWWTLKAIIAAKRFPFVLLENVDRLLKSGPKGRKGRDFGAILKDLADLDYCVEWRVINAADYGLAQRRRRTFIFAYQKATSYAKKLSDTLTSTIVRATGFFQSVFPATVRTKNSKIAEGRLEPTLLETLNNFSFDFAGSGFMRDGEIYTEELEPVRIKPTPLSAILETGVDEEYYLGTDLERWEYLKGSKKLPRVSPEGHEFFYSEGPVPFPDPIDKPARTIITSEGKLNRSTHVVCDPETNRLRLITPVEAERANGFPDNWTNTGMPEAARFKLMGNALVVGLVEKMGKMISSIIDYEPKMATC